MLADDVSTEKYNDINSIELSSVFIDKLKSYNEMSKLNKFDKYDYRDRMNKLYDDIGNIIPIDSEINNVIYFDSFDTVGVILNNKNDLLKQMWTEYRLIYNEKKSLGGDDAVEKSFVLDNFDELFENISRKVGGIDKYISDLNSLKKEIDVDNAKLIDDREKLEIEKINFENYRRSEIARLEKMNNDLKNKITKINNLLLQFDEKIERIEN